MTSTKYQTKSNVQNSNFETGSFGRPKKFLRRKIKFGCLVLILEYWIFENYLEFGICYLEF